MGPCHGEDGFDIGKFEKVLRENKIEWDLDRSKPGWVGRFRMCTGLMLRRHAAKLGFVVIDGKKSAAPGAKRRGRGADV